MTDVRLYLVTADQSHFDDFDAAVVYATDPDDAIAIVLAEIEASVANRPPVIPPAVGVWEPPHDDATLTAVEVPALRGPVLGHAHPC